jgi:hypothetical protein
MQKLLFYPKDQCFVAHFTDIDTYHEAQLHHNVPANISNGVSIHYLFARFAHSLIIKTTKTCAEYAKCEDWHVFMTTEPKPPSSSGTKRTSSIAGMQSSASGSKQAKSTSSAGNDQALQTVNKATILSRVISASTWDELSAASWSPDTSHERTSSATSQDSQGIQSSVAAGAWTVARMHRPSSYLCLFSRHL